MESSLVANITLFGFIIGYGCLDTRKPGPQVIRLGILGQVWYLIVSIPDLCNLTYFEYSLRLKIKRNDWLLADVCPQAANHFTLF